MNDMNWQPFYIKDIFTNIQRGKRLTKSNQTQGNIPYISSTSLNNGVDNFIGNVKGIRSSGYDLTIANSGSVGSTFYHDYEYVASDHVHSLSNEKFNKYHYMFLSVLLNRLKGKYHFNREINEERLKNDQLMLPVDNEGKPNWQYMEDKGKELYFDNKNKIKDYLNRKINDIQYELNIDRLKDKNWKSFQIDNLFIAERVKGNVIDKYEAGKIPYITTSSENNGVTNFVLAPIEEQEYGSSLTINPISGDCFYQPYNFVGRGGAGSSIYTLRNLNINKYSGLFISKMIMASAKHKASYGVQLNGNRLKNTRFMLPITNNREPDWKYMTNYMKQLEYRQIKKTLHYLNNN